MKKEVASVASIPPEKAMFGIEGSESGTYSTSLVGSVISGTNNQTIIKTANGVNLNGHLVGQSGGHKQLVQVFIYSTVI